MVEMEDDERRNGWTARDFNAIEIRRGGVSTLEAAELGAPDFSMEDLGEDHSGLKGLKSDVDEEPIYIDFDEELREVSSTKD